MAAALTCGEGAAVSHRSAAALWGLLKPGEGPIDVVIPGSGGRKPRQGIRLHRCISLLPDHVTRRRGIPVTTPARTISDFRLVASEKELRWAIRQADVLGLPIGAPPDADRTRSELEAKFLRLCRRHGLPTPEVNVRLGRHLIDFLWREERLVVETDGYRYHRGRQAFEDDRSRDLDLRSLGYDVLRFSYRQVSHEPGRIVAAVRDAIAP
ncbi:MAG: endonuclease domain-containing protein [Solirubrobacterales bacterium]